MKKSTQRVLEGILKKEKIGIFGDYDVDGATSTALLGNYFSELNLDYEIYIPDRKREGYGPSIQSFQELIKKKVKTFNIAFHQYYGKAFLIYLYVSFLDRKLRKYHKALCKYVVLIQGLDYSFL